MPELEAEALRVYRRYQREVVEALNLCPWAERARLEGRVTERVLLQRSAESQLSLRAIRELEAMPATLPRLEPSSPNVVTPSLTPVNRASRSSSALTFAPMLIANMFCR